MSKTIFSSTAQVTREHGNDWAIQLPPKWSYATLLIAANNATELTVWGFASGVPEELGVIEYGKCRPHIDNEFSPGCLLRTHGPVDQFDNRDAYASDEGEAFFLVSRTHPRYGMNPDRMGLPLPDGVESDQLVVGTRILCRFPDKRDREGIITRCAPPGTIGDSALPMRVLIDNRHTEDDESTLSEAVVDYRQVVRVLGKLDLPVR